MTSIVQLLWLIPALPLLAAGITAFAKQRNRSLSAGLAIAAMAASFVLSLFAFANTMQMHGALQVVNFPWFQAGEQWVRIGWMLDPLTAVMLMMITLVALLVFIFSVGYMHDDENFTRFFCFLSLFSGAMLGVVIANSLLLLFMCWEIVGLTSYLLIGFWYHKPSAVAAAKKAFIVTRIGDLSLFLGMVWLAHQAGTLLFYDNGLGFLEHAALSHAAAGFTLLGLSISTAIGLLIFGGAVGKSGQFPLHVWLPDAMEGPTPVSALIHAATMVAAGVFLVARVYPLLNAHPDGGVPAPTPALEVITWVGAITALLGAMVAVAHFDIKRILAYSTISQLGYMMMGLGIGGVAVGIFHLITHAFFKALLFLCAGSVIHGCFGEQDVRRMGGLRRFMPITFATYMVGMLALCGFPFFFSGFWSKDEILHAAHGWTVSRIPFYMAAFAALLTAFYMARQASYVFGGKLRLHEDRLKGEAMQTEHADPHHAPHESPRSMTLPLAVLAVIVMLLGAIGTPAWPWFHSFVENTPLAFSLSAFHAEGLFGVMLASSLLVFLGLGLGWYVYARKESSATRGKDPLEQAVPSVWRVLGHAFYLDQLYARTVVRLNAGLAAFSRWMDKWVWGGAVQVVAEASLSMGRLDNLFDTDFLNAGFDKASSNASHNGMVLGFLQGGRVQTYLRLAGASLIVLVIILLWSSRA